MIEYVKKDITTVTKGVIAHGVNCQGKMNSGVAKAIRDTWPVVYDEYKRCGIGKTKLGHCNCVSVKGSLWVANCFTQEFYGSSGGPYANVEAIETSLYTAYSWAAYYRVDLYLPKIGAGLGGLDWEIDVFPVIEKLDALWPTVNTYICIFGE